MEDQLEAGRSFVTEMNFYQEFDTPRFYDFKNRFDVELIQVHCSAEPEVLIERDLRRWESGERHKGHVYPLAQDYSFGQNMANGSWNALNIDGHLIRVDTTDFSKVDYEFILGEIGSFANNDCGTI